MKYRKLDPICCSPTMDLTVMCWNKTSTVNFMKGLGRCYKRERERAASESLSVNDDETNKVFKYQH